MIRVLFLSYFFPPTGGAPAQRSMKFARYLPDEGYLPVVVTGPGTSQDEWSPRDASLLREVPATVAIHRVQTAIPPQKNKMLRRAQRWLGLRSPFSDWWIHSAIRLGEKALTSEGAKLIYASMSPFESADVAAYLSRKHSIPWVADLRDPWAIDEIQVFPSLLHKKIALRKMHELLSTASIIIMNTQEASDCLKRTFPDFRRKRIVTITNGFDPEDLSGNNVAKTNGKFTIVHAGSFLTDPGLLLRRRRRLYEGLGGALPGIDIATRSHLILFEAAHRWCSMDPSVKEDLQIVFAGNAPQTDSPSQEENSVRSLTHFAGYLPRNKSLAMVRAANLLFLAMHNLPEGQRSTTAPSKMYEYMASGRPILAAVPDGDAKDFLMQSGTAFVCRPDDREGMIEVLSKVYGWWKAKKQPPSVNREFLRAFDRRNLTKSLARSFDAALGAE
jgi:glycosyltransferase involved in cell wall biosynthesis